MDDTRPALRFELSGRTLLWIGVVAAGVWLLTKLWWVLVLVAMSLVLAGTLRPLVAALEARRVPRSLALAIVFLGLTAALTALCIVTLPPLVAQLADIVARAPEHQRRIVAFMKRHDLLEPLAASVQRARIGELIEGAGQWMLTFGSRVVIIIAEAVTVLFLALYIIAGREREQGAVFAVVPRRYHLRLARILLNLETIVGGYVRGQLITSAAIVAFTFVLLTLANVENALAISIFAGITNVLPFIGSIIAGVPAVLGALNQGMAQALIVLVAFTLYQEFESRVIVPRVYGRVLRLSPVAVIVALLVGGTLLGVVGALLALPAAAAIRMIVRELRVGMPGDDLDDTSLRARDEEAEREFAHLAAGAPAAEAAAIATRMAEDIREADAPGDPEAAAEVPVTDGDGDADNNLEDPDRASDPRH
jgi:predicted PurR-regulated permease PerM